MPKPLGPGPGAYMLPPTVGYEKHDYSRYRNPQYSMGVTLRAQKGAPTPGPQYTVGAMTRYGKSSPPAYSVASRIKPMTAFQTPAPGAYSPEKGPRMKDPRPPAYSIYSRTPPLKKSQTPGPNQYGLPAVLGPKVPNKPAAAAFSISPKFMGKEIFRSPGPAQYTETSVNINKNRNPMFSISPRCPPLRSNAINPGPAGYLPKFQAPIPGGCSFGLKTSQQPYITANDNMPCMDD